MSYKDSGIDWIGDIPEHWNTISNRHLFQYDGSKVGNNYKNYSLLSLTTNGVREKDINETGGKVPTSYESYQTVKSGQMIFCLFDLDCSAVFSGLSKFDGMITSAYDVFSCTNLINSSYADYFFQYVFSNRYYKTYSKNVRYTITGDTFASIKTPVPPYDEQEKISTFLDVKINQSKVLIDNLNAQIDKLKEYKKALITKCVTKGLDPNVSLKDSGIDWISEIPENWILIKAKRCIMIQNGSDPKTEGDIPVYGSGSSTFKTCGEFKNGPAVLLGRKGSISTPHYVEGKYWNVDTAFNVSTNEFVSLRYYFYLANCFDYSYYMSQTTLPSMTQTNYENMSIPLPNIDLQNEIVSYLDNKCSKIDSLISFKQQQIDKLNEYQKSLIYEYVTGKKEVV